MASNDTVLTQMEIGRLFPPVEESSEILVAVGARDYSASAIARAVEDCDSHLLNLNLLADTTEADERIVALRVDLRSAAPVVRSLERYGMRVVAVSDSPEADADGRPVTDPYDATVRERVNAVLRYLEI